MSEGGTGGKKACGPLLYFGRSLWLHCRRFKKATIKQIQEESQAGVLSESRILCYALEN